MNDKEKIALKNWEATFKALVELKKKYAPECAPMELWEPLSARHEKCVQALREASLVP